MATGILTADGTTKSILISKGETHVSLNGTFGGGVVAIEKVVNGQTAPAYDSTTAITVSAPEDMILSIGEGIKLKLTLSGATSPNIIWSISAVR